MPAQPGARRVLGRSAVSQGCHGTDGEAVVQRDRHQTPQFWKSWACVMLLSNKIQRDSEEGVTVSKGSQSSSLFLGTRKRQQLFAGISSCVSSLSYDSVSLAQAERYWAPVLLTRVLSSLSRFSLPEPGTCRNRNQAPGCPSLGAAVPSSSAARPASEMENTWRLLGSPALPWCEPGVTPVGDAAVELV